MVSRAHASRANTRLADILLKAGIIDDMQLRSALAKLDQWGGFLPKVIADLGFTDEERMTAALGEALRVPVQHLGTVRKDGAALARVDLKFAEAHGVFPVSLKDRVLTLAMVDPTDLAAIDELSSKANARVAVVLASPSEVMGAISLHYRGVHLHEDHRGAPARASQKMAEETNFELDMSAPPKPGEAPEAAGPPIGSFLARPPSANTLLDEMLGDEHQAGLSPEELKRLEAVAANQERATSILRALEELLREKGLLPR